MLVLAHREELIDQAHKTLLDFNPTKRIGIEYGRQHASPDDDIVVASIAGLWHPSKKRLTSIRPETFSIIVYDEAHHAPSGESISLLRRMGLFKKQSSMTLIGFTATPFRTDGIKLESVFERIVFHRTLEEMIRNNVLARIKAYRVGSHTDLSNVKHAGEDFDGDSLQKAVDNPERNALILDAYRHRGDGQQAIVFCAGVKHATHIKDAFLQQGISAAVVHGGLAPIVRKGTIKDFKEGRVRVLTNFNVLTEGFDHPSVKLLIMARPTTSGLVLTQAVGRVTRRHEETQKEECLVIEIADSNPTYKVLGVGSLFQMKSDFDAQGQDVLNTKDIAKTLVDQKITPPGFKVDSFTSARQVQKEAIRYIHSTGRTRAGSGSGQNGSAFSSNQRDTSDSTPKKNTPQKPQVKRPQRTDRPFEEEEIDLSLPQPKEKSLLVPPKMLAEQILKLLPPELAAPTDAATFSQLLEETDLLDRLQLPEYVEKQVSLFTWERRQTTNGPSAVITLKDDSRLEIAEDLLGRHVVTYYHHDPKQPLLETPQVIATADTKEAAFQAGDNWINQHRPTERTLYNQCSPWRQYLATPKQLAILSRYHYDQPGMTRGYADQLIKWLSDQENGRVVSPYPPDPS